MEQDNFYNELREKIIETSFYITKYTGEKDFIKVKKYRDELNRYIDLMLTHKYYIAINEITNNK